LIQTEISLLTNNCIIPFQSFHLEKQIKCIEFNKLFATQSIAEHGLGFLINIYEIDKNPKKLIFKAIFDTGSTNLTFIHNLNVRGIQLYDINSIVLSHWHYDHTGGLYKILEGIENNIPVICHESAQFERFFRRTYEIKFKDLLGKSREEIVQLLSSYKIVNQEPINRNKIDDFNGKIIFSNKDFELFNRNNVKIGITGEIPRKYEIEDFNSFYMLREGIITNDKILDDKCLILEYEDNIILITGCCHSGIMNTLDYIQSKNDKPISHIIGGFHMANATNVRIKQTIEYLKTFQKHENTLFLFPLHCSGQKFLFELIKLNSPRFKAFNVSVGTVFNF
jgi:7,8-dihydropterin-6-yl-methyl-4-(beta-D-ribofuranosyl)aminobenzene 5'-phosphate synthase